MSRAESSGHAIGQLPNLFIGIFATPLEYINLYSPTSGSKERNIQTYNNFRRSREFCVICCEFDVATGTCCVGFIKDRMVNSFYSIAIAGK